MPPNRPKRAAAIIAGEVIRKKMRGDNSHTCTFTSPMAAQPQLLEEWNVVQRQQQQLNASRQQMLNQMIHPSRRASHDIIIPYNNEMAPMAQRDEWVAVQSQQLEVARVTAVAENASARHHYNNMLVAQTNKKKDNPSRQRRRARRKNMSSTSIPSSQQQQQRRPPSTRVAAHEARMTIRMNMKRAPTGGSNKKKNQHEQQHSNNHMEEGEELERGPGGVVLQVAPPPPPRPPPPSHRSAVWKASSPAAATATQQGNANYYLSSPVPEPVSRPDHSHAAGGTIDKNDAYSSSSWSESSVGGRARGMNASQPSLSTVARAAATTNEQDSGNESDSSRSWEQDTTTAQLSRRQRKTLQKNKKQNKKEKQHLEKGSSACCSNCAGNLVPHSKKLQRLVCTNCHKATGVTKMKLYVEQRKAYNKQQDLVKVVARPNPATLSLIKSIKHKFNVSHNVGPNHGVVLAGSMTLEKASDMVNAISDISIAHGLRFNVSKVAKLVGVKRGNKALCLRLVATDTRLLLPLERARKQHGVLPQWPLSLVLGSSTASRQAISYERKALNDGRVIPTLVFESLLTILDSSGQPIRTGIHQQDTTIKAEVEEPAGQSMPNVSEPLVDSEESSAQLKNDRGANPAAAEQQNTQHCSTCTFIPHPSEREAVVCCECGKEKSARDGDDVDIVWFNNLRRRFLCDRHSWRISAKLDERSRALIEPLLIADHDDAASLAAASYERITLVDGLMEWSIQSTQLLNDIQHAIQLTPALQIVGSHFIPTASESSGATTGQLQLLVIDLRPDHALSHVLFEAAQSSLVAQSPLRFSIGLVPCRGGRSNAITDILKSLVGSSLFLDAGSVASQSASW